MGNRKRLQTLVEEIRRSGFEVHFAGIDISPEEKTASTSMVDAWVHDFRSRRPEDTRWPRKSGALQWVLGELAWRLRIGGPYGNHQRADEFVSDSWLKEAVNLQIRERYDKVMVLYAYRSRLLEAFPLPCHRILETQEIFTERARKLRRAGVGNIWFSCDREEERRALLRSHTILAIQHHEAAYFRELMDGRRKIHTVGHISPVRPLPPPTTSRIGYVASNNPLNIAGIQWFVEQVWPQVLQACPDATLEVIGDAGETFRNVQGIVMSGRVPAIESAYQGFLFTINPMPAGTGLKIKTVESLAYGRPVVATTAAAEGLESFAGQGLLIADSAPAFADAVVSLWRDAASTGRLGTAAVAAMASFAEDARAELRHALLENHA